MHDFLSTKLNVDDYVAVVTGSVFEGEAFIVGKIIYFTDKMVKVEFPTRVRTKPKLLYSSDLIKIPEEKATFYLLKHIKK